MQLNLQFKYPTYGSEVYCVSEVSPDGETGKFSFSLRHKNLTNISRKIKRSKKWTYLTYPVMTNLITECVP